MSPKVCEQNMRNPFMFFVRRNSFHSVIPQYKMLPQHSKFYGITSHKKTIIVKEELGAKT